MTIQPDIFLQSELFGPSKLERRFEAGKAMARGLAARFDPLTHLDDARAFCCEVLKAYWKAKTAEYGVDWSINPMPVSYASTDSIVENLAWELGETAAQFEPAEAGYLLGTIYTAMLPRAIRSGWGAYYTPTPYVNRLLDMAEESGFDWGNGRIIDPACGGGAFLAPVALRMAAACSNATAEIKLSNIVTRLIGIEIDSFAAWMSHVLLETALFPLCIEAGRRMPNLIHVGDALDVDNDSAFDLVIGNPPYGRTKLSPERRERYSRTLYGHANLYGLFTDLAMRMVKAGGLIAYVTPTSFLGGQYFKALRQTLIEYTPPCAINFIEDREGVFDDVLQETLLAIYAKPVASKLNTSIQVATLLPHENGCTVSVCPSGKVALPEGDAPWLLPRSPGQATVFSKLTTMDNRLCHVGYSISTGQLVWNRHKTQLRQTKDGAGVYPLIWAESVSPAGFSFSANRRGHVPYIQVSPRQSHLLTHTSCVLVQRTTAKEQSRRLIAAVMPDSFVAEHGAVVIENHLNIVHAKQESNISPATIAALLNSRAIDTVFRCLSGSVAVSAYELNALPLPGMDDLESIDRMVRADADFSLIEKRLDRIYGVVP